MTILDYRVGLIIPPVGLNENQLKEVTARLRSLASLLPENGRVLVRVPGFEHGDNNGVPAAVVNLTRLHKVRVATYPFRSRDGHTPARIITDMTEFQADEIWCCPGPSHDRCARVYRAGQSTSRPARFKKIPTWTEPVTKQKE